MFSLYPSNYFVMKTYFSLILVKWSQRNRFLIVAKMRVPGSPRSSWLLALAPETIGSGPSGAEELYLPRKTSIFKVEVRKSTKILLPIITRMKKMRLLI